MMRFGAKNHVLERVTQSEGHILLIQRGGEQGRKAIFFFSDPICGKCSGPIVSALTGSLCCVLRRDT